MGYRERGRAPLFAPSARATRRRCWCIAECVNAPRKMRALREKVISCTRYVHVLPQYSSSRQTSLTRLIATITICTYDLLQCKVHFVINENIRCFFDITLGDHATRGTCVQKKITRSRKNWKKFYRKKSVKILIGRRKLRCDNKWSDGVTTTRYCNAHKAWSIDSTRVKRVMETRGVCVCVCACMLFRLWYHDNIVYWSIRKQRFHSSVTIRASRQYVPRG